MEALKCDSHKLKEFEELIKELLLMPNVTNDFNLLNVLTSNGWTGTRFRCSPIVALDPNSLFLAFLNLHLRTNFDKTPNQNNIYRNKSNFRRRSNVNDILDISDSNDSDPYFDMVKSFCPDILLTHLLSRPVEEPILQESASTFHAACMLVDISGFSKFSSSMCSKGVTGLDDLHKVTNDFLGHFVDVVYQYHGDGKLHFFLLFP